MKIINSIILYIALFLVAGCASETTYPSKSVELVVPYSAGGGSDINGRTIAEIVQKYKFSPEPLMVVNKPGGSGAVGNAYSYSKKGSDYSLLTMIGGQAASAIYNNADVKADMFTPIAVMLYDVIFLGVGKSSPFRDLKSLVEYAKANPGEVVIGGPNIGNEEHYAYKLLENTTGIKLKYVSFSGTGEVVTALLGDHIDVGLFKPAAAQTQVEVKNINPLVVYSGKRLKGEYLDVPTFEELGYKPVDLQIYRAIVAPPGISAEAVKFWEDVLRKVSETPEWQEGYIQKSLLNSTFIVGEEARKFISEDQKKFAAVFAEIER